MPTKTVYLKLTSDKDYVTMEDLKVKACELVMNFRDEDLDDALDRFKLSNEFTPFIEDVPYWSEHMTLEIA